MKTYLELCENLCDYLYLDDNKAFKDTVVQFDFNPMSGF